MKGQECAEAWKLLSHIGITPDTPRESYDTLYIESFLITKIYKPIMNVEQVAEQDVYEFWIPGFRPVNLVSRSEDFLNFRNCIFTVQPHQCNTFKQDFVYGTVIIIPKFYFESLLRSVGKGENGFCNENALPSSLVTMLQLFQKKMVNRSENLYSLMLLRQLICVELAQATEKGANTKIEQDDYSTLQPAIEYIQKHFDGNLTVLELAELCNLSYSYFSSCFRKAYHDTPKVYITKLRVLKAESYLRDTSLSVKQVSLKCGFEHFNTFTAAFKKYVGMSPREYRNRCN